MKIKRTHDMLYLNEDRRESPKEYFKFIATEAKVSSYGQTVRKPALSEINPSDINSLRSRKSQKDEFSDSLGRVLDIGCATGDFLHYLHSINTALEFTGIDVLPELLDQAKKHCPWGEFINGDIFTGWALPDKKFDLIFMNGVHSIFDDYRPWIKNLLRLVHKNSKVYVFGIFNPANLDVIIKSKESCTTNDVWETGWNLFSIKSIKAFINEMGFVCEFKPWSVPIDLPVVEDPLRTYTLFMENHERIAINGLQLVHRFYLLTIKP